MPLLVIDGASAVERYNNGHAAWYATGIGAYFAHGTESHALFMMEGTLWDVRTGYLYGTQTAEGKRPLSARRHRLRTRPPWPKPRTWHSNGSAKNSPTPCGS
jgi:hypothetical protein